MTVLEKETESLAEIARCLVDYFDGLYLGDTERLARIFHPQARYVCATGDEFICLGLEEYFPIVDARPSPSSQNEARRDRISHIALAGPDTGFVRAHCSIGPKHFTDLLTLVRTDGDWRIISKVFHYDLEDQPV